jgi:hypothetical protein
MTSWFDFEPALPVFTRGENGEIAIHWPRDAEIEAIALWSNRANFTAKVLQLVNVDGQSIGTISEALPPALDRPLEPLPHLRGKSLLSKYLWPEILCGYFLETQMLPLVSGANLLAGRRTSSDMSSASAPLRNLLELLERADVKLTGFNQAAAIQVLNRVGVKCSTSGKDEIEVDSNFRSFDARGYGRHFSYDIEKDSKFREYVTDRVFLIKSTSGILSDVIVQSGLPMKVMQYSLEKNVDPGADYGDRDGVYRLKVGVISVPMAADAIKTAFGLNARDTMAGSFVKLVLQERAGPRTAADATEPLLNEAALRSALPALRDALGRGSETPSLEPKSSPLQVEVIDERLVLENDNAPSTRTPIAHLEAMRSHYHSESRRLIDNLRDGNAAGSIVPRLRSIENSLSSEFTDVSSLIIADQARSLELMLPALEDVLLDVAAKDVAAFVGGLGLLARQFPAWRDFVEEAASGSTLNPADEHQLIQAAQIISGQPDDLVDPKVKSALSKTEEARVGLHDSVLDLALIRAVGNVIRAAARYLHQRAVGAASAFNTAVDKELGDVLAKGAVAGLLAAAGNVLLPLATSLPAEFGWLLAFTVFLGKNKAQS